MDKRLAAWARQVKARSKTRSGKAVGGKAANGLPALWLFTDAVRLPDPLPAIARLPRGCGVVFRHDGVPGRAALAAAAARLCRQRGILMTVASDPRLAAAVGAGLHLRGGRAARPWRRGWLRPGQPVTSSAHDAPDLVRARRAGASAAFVSPLFATLSHPGARPLGPVRWAALTKLARGPVLALGGVSGATVRRVPPAARGGGVIGAASLLPSSP
jgi:thiamine-phosphate pyrophosphorylase